MSDPVQGADRHLWETEYAGLEDALRTDPAEALPELLDLVERMLDAAGQGHEVPGGPDDPVIAARTGRARELVELHEAGEPVPNDDAFQAAGELRELYRELLDRPETESGADLRDGVGAGGG